MMRWLCCWAPDSWAYDALEDSGLAQAWARWWRLVVAMAGWCAVAVRAFRPDVTGACQVASVPTVVNSRARSPTPPSCCRRLNDHSVGSGPDRYGRGAVGAGVRFVRWRVWADADGDVSELLLSEDAAIVLLGIGAAVLVLSSLVDWEAPHDSEGDPSIADAAVRGPLANHKCADPTVYPARQLRTAGRQGPR
jgi:hypothetical protein